MGRGRQLGRPGTRLRGGLLAVLVVLAVLGARLVQLQGLSSTAYASSAERQRTQSSVLMAARGSITDRHGAVLAADTDGAAVFGEPRTIARASCAATATSPCRPDTIAAALGGVLGVPVADLTAQLSRPDTGFVYLARDRDPSVGAAVRALKLVGIGVLAEPRRSHPGKDLAANVIGFTNRDRAGAGGVEVGWDSVLKGRNGKAVAEVDNGGHVIATAGQHLVEPVPGGAVQLTIDRDVQWYAQQVLAAKVAETGAENGSVVVMDVKTGQLLALASAPTFDPDNPGATPQQLNNPPLSDVYEPGSVTKVITAAAALEAGVVTPDSVVTVPPTLQVADHTVHDAESHGLEQLTFTGVIVKSSNIGTVEVAQQLGADRLHDAMVRFGFGEKTGLGMPGESRGILADVKDWSGTSIATIPIGQGVAANAVQVASVYATVANDGVRVTPSIVKATASPDGTLQPAAAPDSRRVVSSTVAAQLRTMLEGVVSEEGTAPLAAIPGYRIAGKTGTAQRVVDGRYVAGNFTSSFAGFAPADAPQLVTAVVLQGTGSRGYYGGAVAGPVFKDVMGFALTTEHVPPTDTQAPVLRLRAD